MYKIIKVVGPFAVAALLMWMTVCVDMNEHMFGGVAAITIVTYCYGVLKVFNMFERKG